MEDSTRNVIREVDGNLRMAKQIMILPFLSVLIVWACAPAREKKTSLEIPFKKIDHFMMGKYEVGVLEYEPYLLASGYIQLYYLPVYEDGKRTREFYVNLYGNPDDFQLFAEKKVSKYFVMNQPFLWLLEEKTPVDPHLIKKRYAGAVEYEEIKEDLIRILRD